MELAFETGDCLKTGTDLGRFSILGTIGRDTTGTLYRVRQDKGDRLAVLRVLDPSVAENPGLQQQIKRAMGLRHRNVQRAFAFGRRGRTHYIGLEYMPGRSLRAQLELGRLDPYESLKIINRVGGALRAAGKAGLEHGDLRPANILLCASGTIKVIGIGLPRDPRREYGLFEHDHPTTPFYTAPEILRDGARLDQRGTVLTLGAILYHMLSGDPPMYGTTLEEALMRQASHGIEPLAAKKLRLPPGACALVEKALQPYPLRHRSISEFRRELVGVIRQIKTASGRYRKAEIAEESAVRVCFKK